LKGKGTKMDGGRLLKSGKVGGIIVKKKTKCGGGEV